MSTRSWAHSSSRRLACSEIIESDLETLFLESGVPLAAGDSIVNVNSIFLKVLPFAQLQICDYRPERYSCWRMTGKTAFVLE
mmetsp:Transcript_21832/g.33342  ORF Transcript_21832/g.33342 Transcript_21832/m.33342 type:complete len:82 (+) Transcript_21832:352-597(+)